MAADPRPSHHAPTARWVTLRDCWLRSGPLTPIHRIRLAVAALRGTTSRGGLVAAGLRLQPVLPAEGQYGGADPATLVPTHHRVVRMETGRDLGGWLKTSSNACEARSIWRA